MCQKLNPDYDYEQEARRISQAYKEPHRAYHTLSHISHCLGEFVSCRHLAEDRLALQIAIWFHDFRYEPGRTDNEEWSGREAARFCHRMKQQKLTFPVFRMIMATKHTKPSPYWKIDTQLLVDIDIAILGRSWREFKRYEDGIKQEYRIEPYGSVPEEVFARERVKILEGFLSREHIYCTEFFREKYEEQAEENLRRSIRELEQYI